MNKATLLTAGAVLALAGYAYYFEYRPSQIEAEQKKLDEQIISLSREQISQLSMTWPEKDESFTVEKNKQGWIFQKPEGILADSVNIEQLLARLTDSQYISEVESGEKVNWALFGLDKPGARMMLIGQNGKRLEFAISEKTNYQGDVYLRPGQENRVLLAPKLWLEAARYDLFYFRDKSFLRLPESEISKIELKNEVDRFTLIQKDNSWVSTKQPNWILDQKKVLELISLLRLEKATGVETEKGMPAKPVKFGLQDPLVSLKINEWQAKLGISSSKDYYLWSSEPDRTWIVDATFVSDLLKQSLDSLRDRNQPFEVDFSKVTSIKYKGSSDDELKKLDRNQINELLASISELEVKEFSPKSQKKEAMENLVELYDEENKLLLQLRWYDLGEEKTTLLQSSKATEVLAVPTESIKAIELKLLEKTPEVNDT